MGVYGTYLTLLWWPIIHLSNSIFPFSYSFFKMFATNNFVFIDDHDVLSSSYKRLVLFLWYDMKIFP